VTGCCGCGDEPSGSGATELVGYRKTSLLVLRRYPFVSKNSATVLLQFHFLLVVSREKLNKNDIFFISLFLQNDKARL
jgi:hypothetical protein